MKQPYASKSDDESDKKFSRSCDLLSFASAAVAIAVLIGWVLHSEPLKRVAPGFTSMNPLTAICFLISCVALFAARGRLGGLHSRKLAAALSVVVIMLGASKIIDLVFGTHLTPDDVLFASQLTGGQAYPSRMAPNTALCFLLLNLGILISILPRQPRLPALQLAVIPALLLALLAILGYSYDTVGFYKIRTFIPMAPHTAAVFLLMCTALLLSRPHQGFVGLLTSASDAGKTARTLLPACIVIPVVLGWCALTGLRLDLYGLGTATSLLVLLIAAAQCIVVLLVVARLEREERKRTVADQALTAKIAEVDAKAAELARANEKLVLANAAKSSFLSSMSHEIRTPMNAVIGMTSLLLSSPLSREQTEYAETIRASGDHLLTVINEILDFSKIEAGNMRLESSLFDLAQSVEDAMDLVAVSAAQKQLELTYYIDPAAEGAYLGDVGRVRQVMINLLSNAIKFTETGEVELRISAEPLAEPFKENWRELLFSVRDTGIGIPADQLDQLFQPFMQVDATITRRYGGTGLGLVISQKLAVLMGGRTWVESTPGVGSTFYFSIRAEVGQGAAPSEKVAVALNGKRMLAVDDNPTNLTIVDAYAKSWGMECVCVERPAAALELLKSGAEFDIAVLDYHMPDIDGVQLATALRKLTAGAKLPLVLLSSMVVARPELNLIDPRFAVIITKPVKPAALKSAVMKAVAHSRTVLSPAATERRKMPLNQDIATDHPLRILLVEDNPVNQKVAKLLLQKLGYGTDIAANGLEAIAALQRQDYDLALMDVQMPEMDGLEATRQIVACWPVGARPRIVGMTANATDGDRRDCLDAGMDDYLPKPVTAPQLIAVLQQTSRRPE